MRDSPMQDDSINEEPVSERRFDNRPSKPDWQRVYYKRYLQTTMVIILISITAFVLINVSISAYWQSQHQKTNETYERQQLQQNVALKIKLLDLEAYVNKIEERLKQSREENQQGHQTINGLIQEINGRIDSPTGISDKNYLPLKLPFVNRNSQRIEDFLYDNQKIRYDRVNFQRQRIRFIDSHSQLASLHLAKYNLILDEDAAQQAQIDFAKEWERLQKKFELSKLTTELPMCIVSPGYNNNDKFRIEYSLNSLFTQNYTNYKVVIINDASTDGSHETYRKYFQFYQIDETSYTYIQNEERVTALQNIYRAVINHCSKDSVVVTIDADDELNGRNTLKVFNWGYQKKKAGVLYSNFYRYEQSKQARIGFTAQFDDSVKNNNEYRTATWKISHLRTFRAELLHRVQVKDLQDSDGKYFTITYDRALFYPLMELSCGRVNKIEGEVNYIYNVGTGFNDYAVAPALQREVEIKVKGLKRYECDREFDDKMKRLP